MKSFNAIYIMLVFGAKYRLGLIEARWRDQLYAVIGNLAKECACVPLAIGGMPDHVHVLLSVGGDAPSIKDIIRKIKSCSSKWVNENRLCMGRFGWQSGCGKFSYSYRELDMMRNYVQNQETHHRVMNFQEELMRFYKSAGFRDVEDFIPEDLE